MRMKRQRSAGGAIRNSKMRPATGRRAQSPCGNTAAACNWPPVLSLRMQPRLGRAPARLRHGDPCRHPNCNCRRGDCVLAKASSRTF